MGDKVRPLEESDEEKMKVSLRGAPCPLPDDIKKMPRSETVCRYCGVSYLIFNEFHKLNTKINQLEDELRKAKGTAQREKAHREAVELGKMEMERTLQLEVQRKANENKKCMRDELEEKMRNLKKTLTLEFEDNLEQERRELEEEFQKATHEKVERLRRELGDIELERLKRQKADLEARTAEREKVLDDALQKANKKRNNLREYCKQLEERMGEVASMKEKTEQQLKDMKTQSENLRGVCAQQQRVLQTTFSLLSSFGSDLKDVRGFMGQLAGAWQTFRHQLQQQSAQVLSALREDLKHSGVELQQVMEERERLSRQLMEQRRQSEEQLSHHKDSEKDYEETLLRFKANLREKDERWLSSQQRCDTLQEQLSTWQQRHEQITGKYCAAEEEVTRLRKALAGIQQETGALRRERNMLKESHNRALAEMKNNYQNELGLKLAEALEKQRSENVAHLKEQMEEAHREKELELTIDREKSRLLLLEYQRDTARLQQKLGEQEQQVEQLQTELEEERRNREKDRGAGELQRKTREEQIHQKLQIWKQQEELQLSQAKAELQNITETKSQLQQEVAFLQETVRRECEEREELTAALSQAQEQLLCLRSPAFNHSSTGTSSGPQETLTTGANKRHPSQNRVPLTRSATPSNMLRHTPDKSKGQVGDSGPAGRSVESWRREGTLPRLKAGESTDGLTRKIGLVMRLNIKKQ